MLDLDLIFGHPRKPDVRRVDTLGEEDPYAGWLEVVKSDGTVGLVHPDHADDEIIDMPSACPACGGIVFWWDVTGGQHCERCRPRTTAERLRKLAQRLRERYSTSEPQENDLSAVDS
ncbi:MAG: hypothetical protein KJ000_23915 [Pirellulaceae bacterium]|nr:hypothetical protein [Pirellulaceae bacterium]